MEISVHRYIPDEAADATVDGTRWCSITPSHRLWADLQAWHAAGNAWPAPPAPAAPPVPEIISRRQFYQGLAVAEKITKEEALAAIKTGAIPAALQLMLDGMTDPDAQFAAEMLLAGAGDFQRHHPLVMIIGAAQAMSDQDVDAFWRLCAGL